MEEAKKSNDTLLKIKDFVIKYSPLLVMFIVVLGIGLSMIGNYVELRLKQDGTKIDVIYKLTDFLFTNQFGSSLQLLFIFLYMVFPAIACILLFFKKYSNYFVVASMLIFLLIAISSIVTKDVIADSLSYATGLDYSIHDKYFCYILPIIVFFLAEIITLIVGTRHMTFNVADITEMGMFVAIALGLNFLKVIQLGASGGSVNFQMLPLFILALRKGPLKGFIAGGIVYGLISCLTDGYGIATFPFDYLVGMGSVAVLGFFSPLIFGENQKTYNIKGEISLLVAGILATFFRYVGACVSSMVIYGLPLYNNVPLANALSYNFLYVFISGGIAIAIIMAIYGPMIRVNKHFPIDKSLMNE